MTAAGIERVVVVGGGVMGNGIVQVLAQAGLRVDLVDVSEEALERATRRIERSLGRLVGADRLSSDDAEGARADHANHRPRRRGVERRPRDRDGGRGHRPQVADPEPP